MNKIVTFLCCLFLIQTYSLQAQNMPHQLTDEEKLLMPSFLNQTFLPDKSMEKVAFTPPPYTGLRSMAEWEEIQALIITWTTYTSILRDIVKSAVNECLVYINCSDSASVKTYLTSGGVNLTNVRYIIAPYNSVWCRDYSANNVYTNQVDSLILVDWKYNRPSRPSDDTLPRALAKRTGLQLFEMSASPNLLIATGGNYMCDGLGTAMSSKLIEQENTNLTSAQIDTMTKQFMGINRYVHYETLPNDGIHHIDMHMKLLDEETLLVGQYPTGISDGPQIEANIQYLLTTYNSTFGTPYKIVRIPQPPDSVYLDYPPSSSYFTYTNGVFVNKTFIFPTYYTKYDTTAMRIYKENLPGFNVVGINCNASIPSSGAIHCITHCVGSYNPLLISLQRLPDTYNTTTPYTVNAKIMNKSGIQNAWLYYRTDTTQAYNQISMTLTNASQNIWSGDIPPQAAGSIVYYYVKAQSNNGKQQVRPITSPLGFYNFRVLLPNSIEEIQQQTQLLSVYPNPANAITCIPVETPQPLYATIELFNLLGENVNTIFKGNLPMGKSNYFVDASTLSAGTYFVKLTTENVIRFQKLIVQ
ncbi:MAG: agmatine deiminase family protein [Bacteroidota bacterium]